MPAWCAWMSEADLAVDSGQALLDLGDTRRAHQLIREGQRLLPSNRDKTRGVFLAYEARSRLDLGEPERAAAAAMEALQVAQRIGAPRCVSLVRDLVPSFEAYPASPGCRRAAGPDRGKSPCESPRGDEAVRPACSVPLRSKPPSPAVAWCAAAEFCASSGAARVHRAVRVAGTWAPRRWKASAAPSPNESSAQSSGASSTATVMSGRTLPPGAAVASGRMRGRWCRPTLVEPVQREARR